MELRIKQKDQVLLKLFISYIKKVKRKPTER